MQTITMKVCVVIVACAVALVASEPLPTTAPEDLTAFGYLTRFGVPEAQRIRKMEVEQMMNRIVGGQAAEANEFPYQVGLLIDLVLSDGREVQAVCGGSLLTNTRALTAAHCWTDGVNQAWRFTVVLGSNTLFYGGLRLQTTEVKTHEEWSPSLIRNDLAMIYLPEEITFSESIAPIELPSGRELSLSFAGQTGIASGFGLNKSPGGSLSHEQHKSWVDMPVMANVACWLRYPGVIQPGMICGSGGGGKSICSGDSGGPYVVTRKNREILIGVTSFGLALGCHLGWPGVFVRVTAYTDWIKDHLENNNKQ